MKDKKNMLAGLSTAEAKELQAKLGKNELTPQKNEGFLKKVFHIVCEPMFLLLIVAAVIYFILREPSDGAIMLIFVISIISIDVIQEWKTDKTLNALKDLSAPQITVLRDGREQVIHSVDLVPGDLMMIHEGVKIPADGVVMKCSDLCVDESSLTGEAEGVWKVDTESAEQTEDYWRKDYCYAGTLVTQGTGSVIVDKIGAETEYGKIGMGVAAAEDEPTPLQKQTGSLVKLCAGIAAVLFILVGVFTYINLPELAAGDRVVKSILSGITLAMAMIPEEFPVVLTVFLSMGAWRLAKKNSLVRKLPSVETLGAVSVLCVDKTGTITMNKMTVQRTWAAGAKDDNGENTKDGEADAAVHRLCDIMGMGCETDAYDPMEKAMLAHCETLGITKEHLFSGRLITEYPFTNELKMMGHVWERKKDGSNEKEIVIAAKGSPERILTLCAMSEEERQTIQAKIEEFSKEALRVIAVATAKPKSEAYIPSEITKCKLELVGLVGMADPPRESVKNDIEVCKKAGIRVVMITGDNGITAAAIAEKIGMANVENIITGDMLNSMSDEELREKVKTVSVFSRVIPEHKMRIVKALKDNGEIVAMTGDGVNDAPALKNADIGIAMGQRGSEVSREAADLILMDDNFTTIVETVKDGRRIFDNIRKAVGYIFTIHIPIALSSLLGPLMGIAPAALFLLPLHVVILELVIDPTCSVVLERQPAERDIMDRAPRDTKERLMNLRVLTKSVVQGLVLFAASFGGYYFYLDGQTANAPVARAIGLGTIIIGNLFLVQVNSSDRDFAVQSFVRLAKDKVMWLVNIVAVVGLLVILYTPLSEIMKLAPLSGGQFACMTGLAAASVLWYEVVKLVKKLVKR